MENAAFQESCDRAIGAIVSDETWAAIEPAVSSSRLPCPAFTRIAPDADLPHAVTVMVVDLHAYPRLLDLAMAYRRFMRRTLFVAWTPEEELGLLEFIDPADDIVRADAVARQLPLRIERLLSEQGMTRMDFLTGLSNRRVLFQIAEQAFGEGVDADHPISAVTIDLDHFGHSIGLGGRAAAKRAARTIDRLNRFRITIPTGPDEIIAPLQLPALNNRQLDRLPLHISRLERPLRRTPGRTA